MNRRTALLATLVLAFCTTTANAEPTYAYCYSMYWSQVSQQQWAWSVAQDAKAQCLQYPIHSSNWIYWKDIWHLRLQQYYQHQQAMSALWAVIQDGQQNPDNETADINEELDHQWALRQQWFPYSSPWISISGNNGSVTYTDFYRYQWAKYAIEVLEYCK